MDEIMGVIYGCLLGKKRQQQTDPLEASTADPTNCT
jgi:hypothetical protein